MFSAAIQASADETNAVPSSPAPRLEETNSQQTLHAILLLEEQIRSNQLAIERSGNEAREVATRNLEMMSNGLQTIQTSLASQQAVFSSRSAQELETLRSSNRVTLIAGVTFAAIASLSMLFIALFQWRTSKAWSKISAVLPQSRALGPSDADPQPVMTGETADANWRLLGAMEQLERRIQQLEHHSAGTGASRALGATPGDNGNSSATAEGSQPAATAEPPDGDNGSRIAELLKAGKSLLGRSDWEGAVARFDEVLALNPHQGEALVKKGAALEGLQRFQEAFECYDGAIALDDSSTVGYLHKGALFNRLERFKEALECYEKALRAHDGRHC